jgi:sugar O-acyltransferase (sialic acid O-acetyltransferase NeuD family)
MGAQIQYFIFGTGGHSRSATGLLADVGTEVEGYITEFDSVGNFLNKPVINYKRFLENFETFKILIAVGDNFQRYRIRTQLLESVSNSSFPNIIHPDTKIPSSAQLGAGNLIFSGAVVGYFSKIEDFSLLNSNSTLEHDSHMGSYSSLASGACTGGAVKIGLRTSVGLNSSVLQGIEIGDDTVIGAHSFVNKNFPSRSVGYGSPAQIIRERDIDTKYL